MTASKLDLKQALKPLYAPPVKDFVLVEVPPLNMLMIDGAGDPNTSQAYQTALEALYGLTYTLKFVIRKAGGIDFTVMPLEGLWWAPDMSVFMAQGSKDTWQWTMMIAQPDFVTAEQVQAAAEAAQAKKPGSRTGEVRLETCHEGLCLQKLHIGSYADEAPALRRLHLEIIPQGGYAENGHHHEIYLSDPRRTAPDKLRTILRQPVRRV